MIDQVLKQSALMLAILVSQGCASTPTPPAVKSPDADPVVQPSQSSEMPPSPWSVSFADGNANSFRFWQEAGDEPARFEYTPMTPAESSSGIYSGGAPKDGDLSPAEVGELWRHLNRLSADVHAESRMKGTGSVAFTTPEAHAEFVAGSGPSLDEFLTFVQPFRGQ